MQATYEKYASGAASNAATNSFPWILIDGCTEVGFHVSSDSFTGTLAWDVTSLAQIDPNKTAPSAAQIAPVVLVAAEQTLATPGPAVVNHVFSFGVESTNKSALPCAKWMRMRTTRSAGGTATGLNIAITRKGNV